MAKSGPRGAGQLATISRSPFGPRQQPGSPYSGVISLFIEALSEGKPPTIHGDGKQTRDFTFVADVVDGVLRACEAPTAAGEVINVAGGGRISLLEVLRTLQNILRKPIDPTFGPTREGDVRDSQADIHKARQMLGFEPRMPLEDGLRLEGRLFIECQTRPDTVALQERVADAERNTPGDRRVDL